MKLSAQVQRFQLENPNSYNSTNQAKSFNTQVGSIQALTTYLIYYSYQGGCNFVPNRADQYIQLRLHISQIAN